MGYFVGDATNYFNELNETMLDRSRQSTKAAELARQLTAKAGSKIESVKAIRDFVAKIHPRSRAVLHRPAVERTFRCRHDAGGRIRPRGGPRHSASRDVERGGFSAGVRAGLGFAGHRRHHERGDDVSPAGSFQTPLVRITLDGENYYLNDTDQYAQLGSTGCDGALGIALSTQAWEVIHAAKDCEDGTRTDYTLLLDDSGRTRIGVSRWYYGENYNEKHRYFSELPPEERKRYFQETVSEVGPGRARRWAI